MRVYIVGAGAIGKALAVCLKLNGKDVQLIRGSVDDGHSYHEEITLKLSDNNELKAVVEFNTPGNLQELNGLIVLAIKSFGNRMIAEKLRKKAQGSPIVILQNGLGIEQPFLDNDFQDVFRCVLFATSQNISKTEISYKPVAESPVGIITQHNFALNAIVEEMNTPYFRFIAETEIERVVWKKVIVSCVFNSICPLLETDNGVFHREKDVFSLAKQVIGECIMISREKGIDLKPEEIEKLVISISQMSDGQFISTLQDIRNRKKTEIDTMNFEIFRMAEEMGLDRHVQQTKLLGELIKLKSALNR